MGTQHPLPFSPLYSFVARKPFTYDGRDYAPGDAFPVVVEPKIVVEDRILEKFYRSRLIVPGEAPPQSALPKPAPVAPRPAPVEAIQPPAPVDSGQPVDAPVAASGDAPEGAPAEGAADVEPATAPFAVKSLGFGFYAVVGANGSLVPDTRQKDKAAVESIAAKMNAA